MRKPHTLLDINLQLFNGAAGGAGGAAGDGGAAGASQGGASTLPKAGTANSGSSRQRSGDLSNVVYGIQDEATSDTDARASSVAGDTKGEGNTKAEVKASKTPEEMDQAFEDLISGEYKDQFSKRMQQIINRRFKDSKGMEEKLATHQPIIDMMLKRYDVADGDMGKLQKAIEEDNAFWEEIGDRLGFTAKQARAQYQLEMENKSHMEEARKATEMQKAMIAQERQRRQYDAWMQEAADVKAKYPKFNLDAEVKNPQFTKMLQSGVEMEHAYRVLHHNEIMYDATRTAAQQTEQQVTSKLKQKASRPAENGTSSQGGKVYKPNASSWTAKDRAEIARRVARGEQIKI